MLLVKYEGAFFFCFSLFLVSFFVCVGFMPQQNLDDDSSKVGKECGGHDFKIFRLFLMIFPFIQTLPQSIFLNVSLHFVSLQHFPKTLFEFISL